MHPRPVGVVFIAIGRGEPRVGVRQPLGLGDEGDDVLAEAVHAHVQPELHDALDLLAHLRVIHVEVGLLFGEQVQIVFVQPLVVFPCAALEHARPVVRRTSFAAHGLARPPYIIVVIGVILALAALDEPLVLVAGMVDDEIHEHAHTALVRAVKHLTEYAEVSVLRVYVHIVGNIVAEVRVRRRVYRRKPDSVHAETLDVIQLREHAPQVADPIAVAVAEAARPDLVHRHFLMPLL